MSQLRKIMQKLAQAQPETVVDRNDKSSPDAGAEALDRQMRAYEHQLQHCNPAMLQYEWALLEEHQLSLQLCLRQPEMLQAAGGQAKVEHLLKQTELCRALLLAAMGQKNTSPASPARPVAIGEHAWEVKEGSLRRAWGLD